jgi:hypothetical protein
VVVDSDGQPVVGVPIEVGPFQTVTEADGSFQLELPPGKVPTASFDIAIPAGDAHFDPGGTGEVTLPFRRAVSHPATGHAGENPREHPNFITSFIDGSLVYGSDAERAAALRVNDGSGKLKTSDGDLLPQNNATYFPEGPLENENAGPFDGGDLFVAGDVRASENPALIALHTLFVREHNRKAEELAAAHPDWEGEEIFQASRRWVSGLIQHITYHEFLPMLLGEGSIPAYSGYDPSVDPRLSGLFSAAAYRLGHTIVSPEFLLLDENGDPLPDGPLALRDSFFNPQPILVHGIEPILRGLAVQPAQQLDTKVIDDLRNFLFGPPGAGGLDLVSLNLQRGRDMGLPSYNQARIDMELTPAADFADITSDVQLQGVLQAVYGNVDNVDVWVGGLAEDHVDGAMLGELFWTIVRDQFLRLRDGDRFWYENEQFTAAELTDIRGTTLAKVIADNTTIAIESLPASVFTTDVVPLGPAEGGAEAAEAPMENRTYDGSDNNPLDSTLGQAGTNLLVNYTPGYGDGISSPAGANRPPVREVSNAIFDQQVPFMPNEDGATYLLVMWGQLIDHDVGLSPGGIGEMLTVDGQAVADPPTYVQLDQSLPELLGHEVYAGYNNVLPAPLILPPAEGG